MLSVSWYSLRIRSTFVANKHGCSSVLAEGYGAFGVPAQAIISGIWYVMFLLRFVLYLN